MDFALKKECAYGKRAEGLEIHPSADLFSAFILVVILQQLVKCCLEIRYRLFTRFFSTEYR